MPSPLRSFVVLLPALCLAACGDDATRPAAPGTGGAGAGSNAATAGASAGGTSAGGAGGPTSGGANGGSIGGGGQRSAGASGGGPPGGGAGEAAAGFAGENAGGSTSSGSAGAPPTSTCTPAPPSSFDPVGAYEPPPSTPTVVVTSSADSGVGSLRAALATAAEGAVVGFDKVLANKTIVLETTLTLTKGITLDGSDAPGLTLDGQKKVSLLKLNGDQATTLIIRSLRFVRGKTAGSGGAINLNGSHLNVEIAGCRFEGEALTNRHDGAISWGRQRHRWRNHGWAIDR